MLTTRSGLYMAVAVAIIAALGAKFASTDPAGPGGSLSATDRQRPTVRRTPGGERSHGQALRRAEIPSDKCLVTTGGAELELVVSSIDGSSVSSLCDMLVDRYSSSALELSRRAAIPAENDEKTFVCVASRDEKRVEVILGASAPEAGYAYGVCANLAREDWSLKPPADMPWYEGLDTSMFEARSVSNEPRGPPGE